MRDTILISFFACLVAVLVGTFIFGKGAVYGRDKERAAEASQVQECKPMFIADKTPYVVLSKPDCFSLGLQLDGEYMIGQAFYQRGSINGVAPSESITIWTEQGWRKFRESCRKEGK